MLYDQIFYFMAFETIFFSFVSTANFLRIIRLFIFIHLLAFPAIIGRAASPASGNRLRWL